MYLVGQTALTCQNHLEQTRILLHAHIVDAPAGERPKVLVRDRRIPQHVHHRSVLVVAILVYVQVLPRIVELPPEVSAEDREIVLLWSDIYQCWSQSSHSLLSWKIGHDTLLGRWIGKDFADNIQVLVPECADDNYFVCHTNRGICSRGGVGEWK